MVAPVGGPCRLVRCLPSRAVPTRARGSIRVRLPYTRFMWKRPRSRTPSTGLVERTDAEAREAQLLMEKLEPLEGVFMEERIFKAQLGSRNSDAAGTLPRIRLQGAHPSLDVPAPASDHPVPAPASDHPAASAVSPPDSSLHESGVTQPSRKGAEAYDTRAAMREVRELVRSCHTAMASGAEEPPDAQFRTQINALNARPVELPVSSRVSDAWPWPSQRAADTEGEAVGRESKSDAPPVELGAPERLLTARRVQQAASSAAAPRAVVAAHVAAAPRVSRGGSHGGPHRSDVCVYARAQCASPRWLRRPPRKHHCARATHPRASGTHPRGDGGAPPRYRRRRTPPWR